MCLGLCAKLLLLRAENALDVAVSYITCAHTLQVHVSQDSVRGQRRFKAATGPLFPPKLYQSNSRSHLIDLNAPAVSAAGSTYGSALLLMLLLLLLLLPAAPL
jgi:hypothetical protein